MKRILILMAVIGAALVLSSGAFADGLTCAHSSTCQSQQGDNGGAGGGTLPFTGVDLAAIAAVGGILLVGGLTLQRAARRRR